ncbi:MAG: hypothetical protein NTV63_01615 [Candidatus Woesearchaeota archaeon]|nr:hypothetical protein [Candidatus Woesearchaeota archaeon]
MDEKKHYEPSSDNSDNVDCSKIPLKPMDQLSREGIAQVPLTDKDMTYVDSSVSAKAQGSKVSGEEISSESAEGIQNAAVNPEAVEVYLPSSLESKINTSEPKPILEANADELIKAVFTAVNSINQIGLFPTGYLSGNTTSPGSTLEAEFGVDYGNVLPKAKVKKTLDKFHAKYSTPIPNLEIILDNLGEGIKVDDSKLKEARKKLESGDFAYHIIESSANGIKKSLAEGDSAFDYKGSLEEIFNVVKSSENGEFYFTVPVNELFRYADQLTEFLSYLKDGLKIGVAESIRNILEAKLSNLNDLREESHVNPCLKYSVDFSSAGMAYTHEAEIKKIELGASISPKKGFFARLCEYLGESPRDALKESSIRGHQNKF